jgi:hypothetical protein
MTLLSDDAYASVASNAIQIIPIAYPIAFPEVYSITEGPLLFMGKPFARSNESPNEQRKTKRRVT